MLIRFTRLPYLIPATEVTELDGDMSVLNGSPTGEPFSDPLPYDGF